MQMLLASGASKVVEFVAVASRKNTANGTTLVIDKPTGTVDGDVMIAVIGVVFEDSTWTVPSGWTELYDQGVKPNLCVARRTASSEGASYTFTSSASRVSGGSILTYRNAAYDVIGSATTGTAALLTAPQITAAGGVLLASYANVDGVKTFTTPTGMASVVTDVGFGDPAWHIFSETVGAGATGSRASTQSASGTASAGILLSLKLA